MMGLHFLKHSGWVSLLFLVSCATSVKRVDVNSTEDLSGYWNDTDSRTVAQDIVSQTTRMPWLTNYQLEKGKNPSIVITEVSNKTDEHINTDTFINDIERALINSQKLDVIASSDFRSRVRQERKEQDTYASSSTRKSMGQEIGADVLMVGSLSSITDAEGKKAVKFYQIDVRIIDVETNKILWSGQSKIKKVVSGKRFRP